MSSCVRLKDDVLNKLRFICEKRKERGDYCKYQSDVMSLLIDKEYKKESRYDVKNDEQ